MTTFIVRRLCYAILTFFGITVATFALVHIVPGDPIVFFIGTRRDRIAIPPAMVAHMRAEFHLDSRCRCSISTGCGAR